jgi:hypothetical protein
MAEAEAAPATQHLDGLDGGGQPSDSNGGTWEIEELEPEEEARQAGRGAARDDARGQGGGAAASSGGGGGADDVYVAVGKGGSSMAALSWALRRLTRPRSFVYLVHVFPVVNSIPTPCERSPLLLLPHLLLLLTSPSGSIHDHKPAPIYSS